VRMAREAKGAFVLVCPALAAMQGVVPTLGSAPTLVVSIGAAIPPDDLADRLSWLGYVRTDVVEHRGEFAIRGGIVDVFPGTARRPLRAEYLGDEIESLREFSPATQLSTDRVSAAEVHPVRELLPTEEVRERAAAEAPRYQARFRDGLTRLSEGLSFEGMASLGWLLFDRPRLPSELLAPGGWVVVTQAVRTVARMERLRDEAESLAEAAGWPGPSALRGIDEVASGRTLLHLSELGGGVDLHLTGWGTASGNAPELATRLTDLASQGHRVVVTAEAQGSLERAREVMAERGLATAPDAWPAAAVTAPLVTGFVFEPGRLAVATEEDLVGSRRHTRSIPRLARRRAEAVALELEPGDYAVHHVHGIGRYMGIVHRQAGGAERDYLLLEYAQGDRLYVPADQVGVVAKYVGGESPRIHRLGASDWTRTKARVRRALRDMAGELVRLYSVRMAVAGHAFSPDTPWQHELEDAFPYEETRDQSSAIDDVKRDMERPKPMDRLVCGDVGYGKTEIAIRAAFKTVMDGKQVAVLVPTTLLAEQHYVTFSERFAPFSVSVEMLSRFVSPGEQRRI